jgi:hypothetical protein
MNLFNSEEPRNMIQIGRHWIDADMIMFFHINIRFQDPTDIKKNLYKITLMIDMSPQYPIGKYIYISYNDLCKLLYQYPSLMGDPNTNLVDYIKNLEYDISEDMEEMDRNSEDFEESEEESLTENENEEN